MSSINLDNTITLMFLMMGVFVLTVPPAFLLLHLSLPKKFQKKYFSHDFFQTWELNAFSHFPGSCMRTIMLTSIIAFPNLGKKRKMTNAHLEIKPWFRFFAKAYWIYFLFLWSMIVMTIFGVFLYISVNPTSH